MLIYLAAIDSLEEKSTFESIYYTYRDILFRVAMTYLNNEFDAEDAVHQAFVYVAENMQKFSAGVCFETLSYLIKTVRSRAIDIVRVRDRSAAIASYKDIPDPGLANLSLSPLANCIAKVPERYRDALILRVSYGFEFSEIAKLMNISEANARKMVTRAKNKLEDICKEEGIL